MAGKNQTIDSLSRNDLHLVAGTYRDCAARLSKALEKAEGLPGEQVAALFIELRDVYIDAAKICDHLADARRPGRPRVRPRTRTENSKEPSGGWPTNALMSGYVPLKPKAKRGRPTVLGPEFDEATYELVEIHRDLLRQSNRSKPTTKAAIESLLEWYANKSGKRVSSTIKGGFNSIKASYQRGRKLNAERSKLT